MTVTTKPNRAYPSLPAVGGDPPSHTVVLKAVREAIEIHERRTGNKLDSFVRLGELVELGVLRIEGTLIVVPQVLEFADDEAAGEGGVPIGGLYHVEGVVHVRQPALEGSFAFIARTSLGASVNTATFVAADIGAAAADRKVVVVFKGIQNGAVPTTPTMTIGGNAAQNDVSRQSAADISGNSQQIAIFSLDVPAGTTANIVVSFAGITMFDATIEVYRGTQLAVGPAFDTASVGVTTTGLGLTPAVHADLDVVRGAAVVAGVIAYEFAAPDSTWFGLTEDSEVSIYANDIRASASHRAVGAEAPRPITCSFPAFSGGGLANVYQIVAASYAPA